MADVVLSRDAEVGTDTIEGLNRLLVEELRRLVETCSTALGFGKGFEVGLHLVSRADIARLKRDHFGIEAPTDVLAFPLVHFSEPLIMDPKELSEPVGVPVGLGDIVICSSVAADQASFHAGDLAGELALLGVHGLLHLLGFDHEEVREARLMQAEERRLLSSYWGRSLTTDAWSDNAVAELSRHQDQLEATSQASRRRPIENEIL